MIESTPEATHPSHRWRRPVTWTVGVLVVLFGLAQLVPIRVHNPAAQVEPRWDSPQTRQMVVAACFDCHSNESRHFWYEDIAPIKWWTAHHVSDGRRALNFDEWNQPQRAAGRASRSVSRGQMPPSYYTWFGLHGDAKLTAARRQALVTGLEKTIADDPPPGGLRSGRGKTG